MLCYSHLAGTGNNMGHQLQRCSKPHDSVQATRSSFLLFDMLNRASQRGVSIQAAQKFTEEYASGTNDVSAIRTHMYQRTEN